VIAWLRWEWGRFLYWLEMHDIQHEDAGGDWGICERCGRKVGLNG
jgi:hypothetical protein